MNTALHARARADLLPRIADDQHKHSHFRPMLARCNLNGDRIAAVISIAFSPLHKATVDAPTRRARANTSDRRQLFMLDTVQRCQCVHKTCIASSTRRQARCRWEIILRAYVQIVLQYRLIGDPLFGEAFHWQGERGRNAFENSKWKWLEWMSTTLTGFDASIQTFTFWQIDLDAVQPHFIFGKRRIGYDGRFGTHLQNKNASLNQMSITRRHPTLMLSLPDRSIGFHWPNR